MKLKNIALTLVLGSSVAFATGCMDTTPSILLNGSFVLSGTASVENEGTDEATFELVCGEYPSDVTSGTTWTKGQINLALLKACGQYCGYGMVSSPVGGGPNTFSFIAGFMNKLPDSRSVGARGGDGYLDQNDIWVEEAVITFPPELNTFFVDGADRTLPTYEVTRMFSSLLTSGGGVHMTGIPIMQSAGEVASFERFLREDLRIRNEPVTFVAEIQVRGKSDAGTKVESNKFRFPIDICVDCPMIVTPVCVDGGG